MAATKKMDLLTAMEQIVEKAKGSKLGAEFYREANIYIGYVAERLEPPMETQNRILKMKVRQY